MKRRLFTLITLMIVAVHSWAQTSFGQSQTINDGWRFLLADDSTARQASYDDSRWQRVNLPHDWSVLLPMSPDKGSCQGYLPGGIAWYRYHLSNVSTEPGQRTFIYFEGVYNRSDVYINGHLLGHRPNGFASFLYDMTPYLKAGQNNVIAVRVDHSREADSRWYTGSGIYRPVWLITAPDLHLALWGTAWRVKSKKLTAGKGCTVEVDIETTEEPNPTPIPQRKPPYHQAIVCVIDADGKTVASGNTMIAANEKKTVTLNIPSAHLWSLNNPYLYKVVTTLNLDGKEVDRSEVTMGLRTFTFDANHGFALNGQWMKVKGVCLHDDAGVLGTAVPAEVWKRRLENLKSIGTNAIRMSHNPHAPALYALCDSIGLLVMDEASDEWEYPKRKWLKGWNQGEPGFEGSFDFFNEWIERDVADMVRRDRCHPSVFLWSIGNEVDYPNDPYSHPVLDGSSITQPMYGGYKPEQPSAMNIGNIARRLSAVVRNIDRSRAVTGALAGVVMSNETGYPEAVDVVGYNYTESRYGEDHKRYPQRVIYGSENRHDLQAWKAVKDNEHIFGQFLWTGIDYLGESGSWPARGSEAGLLDLAGNVKPNGFYRAALWSEQPTCYIGTYPTRGNYGRRSRNANGTASPYASATWNYEQGQHVRVVCYTNAGRARLLLNGQAVGGAPLKDDSTGILYWDVDYEPGTLRCEALDKDNNVVADSQVETCGRPYALRITTDRMQLRPGQVAHLFIEVLDEAGRRIPQADNDITLIIEGNGARLLGLENGNIRDATGPTGNRRRAFGGRLTGYVVCTDSSRPTHITVRSPLLQSDNLDLNP